MHTPVAVVTIYGFGSNQPRAGAPPAWSVRSSAFANGIGTYHFPVRFAAKSRVETRQQQIDEVCAILQQTRVEKIIIDLRCHMSAHGGGYDLNGHIYTPLSLVTDVLQPLVRAFTTAYTLSTGLSTPPPPHHSLVFCHVCDGKPESWRTLVTESATRGYFFEFITFQTPFLVHDVALTVPYVLHFVANRLYSAAPTLAILGHTFSTHFLEYYLPVLICPLSSTRDTSVALRLIAPCVGGLRRYLSIPSASTLVAPSPSVPPALAPVALPASLPAIIVASSVVSDLPVVSSPVFPPSISVALPPKRRADLLHSHFDSLSPAARSALLSTNRSNVEFAVTLNALLPTLASEQHLTPDAYFQASQKAVLSRLRAYLQKSHSAASTSSVSSSEPAADA